MRVLLVNPYQSSPAFDLPNPGLGYLAAALLAKGHEVTLLDCIVQGIGPGDWERHLTENAYDLIGIQFFTFNWSNVRDMLARARRVQPEAGTICGGPHATAAPLQTMKELQDLDFLVQGEGEDAVVKLLEALAGERELASVPNLVWRSGAELVENPRGFIQDLDSLPMPAWHLMPPNRYSLRPHGVLNRASPIAPVVATRGCPYQCTFCSARAQMGARVRTRSPARILDEIQHLVEVYGVREIHFEDDNLTFHRKFAMELCQGLLDRKLDIAWACPNGVRLDRLDEELLQLMDRSGCYSVAAGIESGSDRILADMKKGTTSSKSMARLKLIRKVSRIQVTGFFMMGYPTETREDLQETIRFMLKAPLSRIGLSLFMPLPGTEAFELLVEKGLIAREPDWQASMNYLDEGYRSYCSIPAQELISISKKTALRFYLRPGVIASILGRIHSRDQVMVMIRYLLYLLGFRFARFF